jgi:SAM-dependent methyltransferase
MLYEAKYAKMYIERTLKSPYTIYKNRQIAEILSELGINSVWDLGGNVSGMMNVEGSLRFQLNLKNIDYNSLDLSTAYFKYNFALGLVDNPELVYSFLNGVVADMRRIPLANESCKAVVCADVIEHIENPERALQEMNRILDKQGVAIVVVPSLYKLDAIQVPHIMEKRFSSHENRMTIKDWIELLNNNGFIIDYEKSRPLGTASGLLYLMWLDENYVPSREGADSPEIFSNKAAIFKDLKKEISSLDSKLDNLFLENPELLDELRKFFMEGRIKSLLQRLMEIARPFLNNYEEFEKMINEFDENNIADDIRLHLQQMIEKSTESININSFFGNSTMLVLRKK